MKTKLIVLAALLASASLAHAGDTTPSVQQLAADTGLTENDVRMLVGARTAFAGLYRSSYQRKERHFREALGEENYQRLMQTGRIAPLPEAATSPRVAEAEQLQAAPRPGG